MTMGVRAFFRRLILWAVVWLCGGSFRKTLVNWALVKQLRRRGQPLIVAAWHDDTLFCANLLGKDSFFAQVSSSRDGADSAWIGRRFGIQSVRGSSSAGSLGLVRNSLRVLKAGGAIAITPDGPRGPRHQAKLGVAQLAWRAGVPIFPIRSVIPNCWKAPSWDRMRFARPFSRVAVLVGNPIYPQAAEGMEPLRLQVEEALLRLTHVAEAWEAQLRNKSPGVTTLSAPPTAASESSSRPMQADSPENA